MTTTSGNDSIFKKYHVLIFALESDIRRLEALHGNHITCKKGCRSCCMSFGILPVEFYAIADAISSQTIPLAQLSDPEQCGFLIDGSCCIYEHRPVICRTQGLPNVYYIDENNAWDLSLCELNFARVDDSYFTEYNCLDMDSVNTSLFELNQSFIRNNPELNLSESMLININDLRRI